MKSFNLYYDDKFLSLLLNDNSVSIVNSIYSHQCYKYLTKYEILDEELILHTDLHTYTNTNTTLYKGEIKIFIDGHSHNCCLYLSNDNKYVFMYDSESGFYFVFK